MIEHAPQKLRTKALWIIIILSAFALMYQPWNIHLLELQSNEGFYATNMLEIDLTQFPLTSAHGIGIKNSFFLYPYMCKIIYTLWDIPIENAMRLTTLFWLFATAVLAGLTAGFNKGFKAGVVAFCFFMGINFIFEKSLFGYPLAMGVFWVFLAHVLWLYFGFIKSNWNIAWIVSLSSLAIAFLAAGFLAIIVFFLPLLFTHRPLKLFNKLSKWGFWVGLIILLFAILSWMAPYIFTHQTIMFDYTIFQIKNVWEYFVEIFYTPFEMLVRLLPWTLIAWMPFCVALRPLDETPIFSHFFRILFFTNFIFVIANPFSNIMGLIYALPSLAVLCGLNYDIGVRRYSGEMRKLVIICSYICACLAIATIVYCFLPNGILKNDLPTFSLAILFLLQGFWIYYYRKNGQIWLILLSISVAFGLFFYGTMNKYRILDRSRSGIGYAMRDALDLEKNSELIKKVYKKDIMDFYNEGVYVNYPIQKINSLNELPKNEPVVYLLNVDFPQFPDRIWTNLFKDNYRKLNVYLWRGELIEKSELVNKLIDDDDEIETPTTNTTNAESEIK